MKVVLITSNDDGKPSKEWVITRSMGERIKAISFLFQDSYEKDEKINLDNVGDDIFKWVFDILSKDSSEWSCITNHIDVMSLFDLFQVVDYLQIDDVQVFVGELLAQKLNKMDSKTLKLTIDALTMK